MRIAITGASGQLGSYILDIASGTHQIVGIDIVGTKHPAHRPYMIKADIRDREAMVEAFQACDAVIHCAAQVSVVNSVKDPLNDLSQNVEGTINLLRSAAACGVGKFVYISSAAAYGNPIRIPIDEKHPLDPISPYGASKMSAEQYCRVFAVTENLPYVVVRPFNFYSPRADPKSPYSGVITKFVEWAERGEPLLVEGDGDQTRDFIHAEDVTRMVLLAATSDVANVTLNCGSGHGTSINELARTVVDASDRSIEVRHIAPRVGDIRHSVSDMSLAESLLGFETQVSLKHGIKAFFD
jgi:UDP-glucose 4-epimerase